ncbi:MAG: DoxX family membrane protein [Propionibacterium sp.]|nr:DoxX family membrane protein [Propionibacterium sp.]
MGLNKLATYVLRAIPGAFILNSGLGKLNTPPEAAAGMQQMAASGIPQLGELEPTQFAKLLSYGEIALGTALLLPFIPNKLAGLGLGAFSGGLLSMYFRNDSMTEEDGIRPSQDGIALAKDSWLAAIALALLLSGTKRAKKAKKG